MGIRRCMGKRGLVSLPLILILLVIVIAWPATTSQSRSYSGTVAKSARLVGDSLRTRFVVDLSRSVPFNIFTLKDPYRIVVDLPNVSFQMPPEIGSKGRGLVSAFRYGLFAKGKSRIVIDITGPVRIDKSFVLKRGNGQPARFVLDLIPTDRANFLREVQKQKQQQAGKSKQKLPVKLAKVPPVPKPKTKSRTAFANRWYSSIPAMAGLTRVLLAVWGREKKPSFCSFPVYSGKSLKK